MSAFETSQRKSEPQATSFPIHLSMQESESLFELNQAISDKLNFVMKNTSEAPVIGSLAAYFKSQMTEEEIALEKERAEKAKAREAEIDEILSTHTEENKVEEKPGDGSALIHRQTTIKDHYIAMDLTKAKTNILTRITLEVGISLEKTKKSTMSPKSKKGGNSKGLAKRKTLTQSSVVREMQHAGMGQFRIDGPIKEPVFRYIPDRATMQRLVLRVSNMKDDLAEFCLGPENGEPG